MRFSVRLCVCAFSEIYRKLLIFPYDMACVSVGREWGKIIIRRGHTEAPTVHALFYPLKNILNKSEGEGYHIGQYDNLC